MTELAPWLRKPHRVITAEDTAAILSSPLSTRALAKSTGICRYRITEIRCGDVGHLTPEEIAARKEQRCAAAKERRRIRDRQRHAQGYTLPLPKGITPDHVLEEAARVHAAPRTIAMERLGDPLPGRSALDRNEGRRQ